MIRHANQDVPQRTISSSSTFKAHLADVRKYLIRRQLWLMCLGFLFCCVTIGGIIYGAHLHYITAGGWGWIKRVAIRGDTPVVRANLFLPLRKVEKPQIAPRSPGPIPFYECGDQLQSCVAFNQPDICCPIGTACFQATFTPSHIVCCNSSSNYCNYSPSNPPKCLDGNIQCSADTGGGCCPNGTICTPNGCVQVLDASIIRTVTPPIQTITLPTPASTQSSTQLRTQMTSVPVVSSAISDNKTIESTADRVTITNTLVEAPATTITIVKQGEVSAGVAREVSVFHSLNPPYVTAWVLLCVAGFMGML